MSELITRTARLTPYAKRPRGASGFVTAYSYEPAPNDPAAPLGNLLIVIEVLSSGRIAEEVVDIVIETIGQRYYQRSDKDEKTSLLDRFEAAIKVTNAELSKYIDQGNAAWVGKMSAVIAVQAGAELHLAQTGSAEAFLARGRSNTRITASQNPRGPQANKTFGAITSGALEDGDRLLFATPALIHQLSLARLRTLMTGGAPASIINEISSLLEADGTSVERIAALAIEVMTPEQAALQLRSEQPDEVVLAADDSILDVARQTAAPLAQTAVNSSVKLGQKAKQGIELARPSAKRAADKALGSVNNVSTNPRGRALVGGGVLIIVIAIIAFSIHSHSAKELDQLVTRYRADATLVESAVPALDGGQKAASEAKLGQAKADLNKLIQDPRRTALDKRLAKVELPTGAPRSLAGLSTQINRLLDQAENVQRKTSVNVVTFTAKMPKFTSFELIGTSLVAVAKDGSSIVAIDTATRTMATSKAASGKLGTVTATGLDSAGDGLYILTAKNEVWLYRPAGDSLEQESVGTGTWPQANSIASYNSNIYLDGADGSVYKSLRTLSGYSPPAPSLDATVIATLKGSHGIAVDGSVYVLTATSLTRYLGGVAQTTAVVPASLAHASIIRLSSDSTTVVIVDPTTGRAGLFRSSSTQMTYSRQIALASGEDIVDAVLDESTGNLYALTAHGVVSVTL